MTAAVETWMNRCQTLVGRVCLTRPEALLADLGNLAADVPLSITRGEQLVISTVLTQVLAQVVQLIGIDSLPEVAAGFLALAVAKRQFDGWKRQWRRVTRTCGKLLDHRKTCRHASTSHPQVIRMLRVIRTEYANSRLSGRVITDAVDVSYWHGTRLVKRDTGVGIGVHLHSRRTAAARRLLRRTTLSIKEIAYAVGYVHQSELARHFSARYGMSPRKYRQMLAARRWLGPVRE